MIKKLCWNKNQDELLGYFAEGLLSVKEQKAIAHLIKDDLALQEEVRIQKEITKLVTPENLPTVPEHVIQNAKNLVNQPFGTRVWSLVVHFTKDAVKMFKSDGVFVNPILSYAQPLRGQTAQNPKTILIKKDFSAVGIQVEIERAQNSTNRIVICAQDLKTHTPVNDFRITLFENDTELESHITDKGKTNFENMHDGRYVVDITAMHHPIARISLELYQE